LAWHLWFLRGEGGSAGCTNHSSGGNRRANHSACSRRPRATMLLRMVLASPGRHKSYCAWGCFRQKRIGCAVGAGHAYGLSTLRMGPRLRGTPLRDVLRPGHEIITPACPCTASMPSGRRRPGRLGR
jgi:hypothetical protein